MFLLKQKVPSRKLTYPIPRHFWKGLSFSPGQICYIVPQNVCMDHQVFGHVYWMNACVWPFSPTQSMFVHTHHHNEYALIFLGTFSCQVFFGILFISYTVSIYLLCLHIQTGGFTQPFLAADQHLESPLLGQHRRSWSRNGGMILRRNRWAKWVKDEKFRCFFVTICLDQTSLFYWVL